MGFAIFQLCPCSLIKQNKGDEKYLPCVLERKKEVPCVLMDTETLALQVKYKI